MSKKELLAAIRKYYEAEGKGAFVDEVLSQMFVEEILERFWEDVNKGNINVPDAEKSVYKGLDKEDFLVAAGGGDSPKLAICASMVTFFCLMMFLLN